jgi:hypothetical protein
MIEPTNFKKSLELREIMNHPAGITPEHFMHALQVVDSMTLEEVQQLYATDLESGATPNAANEILRGVILERLLDAGIDLQAVAEAVASEFSAIIPVFGNDYTVNSIASDKRTRAREDKLFSEFVLEHPEFKKVIPKEIVGLYARKSSGKQEDTLYVCKVVGVSFTDRVGLPMFLSSLRIKVLLEDTRNNPDLSRWVVKSKTDEEASQIKDLPISEKSFRAPLEVWKQLLDVTKIIQQTMYKVPHLSLRSFFVSTFQNSPDEMLISKKFLDYHLKLTAPFETLEVLADAYKKKYESAAAVNSKSKLSSMLPTVRLLQSLAELTAIAARKRCFADKLLAEQVIPLLESQIQEVLEQQLTNATMSFDFETFKSSDTAVLDTNLTQKLKRLRSDLDFALQLAKREVKPLTLYESSIINNFESQTSREYISSFQSPFLSLVTEVEKIAELLSCEATRLVVYRDRALTELFAADCSVAEEQLAFDLLSSTHEEVPPKMLPKTLASRVR